MSNDIIVERRPIPYAIYKNWLAKRETYCPPREELPDIGFHVCVDGKPVAAGYLRKCEGDYGMIDSLATDPDASATDRDKALNYLVEQLILAAHKNHMKVLVSFSFDQNTIDRARGYGFEVLPHKTLVKSLMERY